MQTLEPELTLDSFFARLRAAKGALLLTDYDGTLAPFEVDPGRAVPYPGVRRRLDAIAGADTTTTTRVVVISGRNAREVAPLLGLERPVEIWGCHGWERMYPDGTCETPPIPRDAQEGLAAAVAEAAGAVRDGARIERKPVTVALHWRGLAPPAIANVREAIGERWRLLADQYEFGLADFDGGIELRASTRNKGDAVRELLAEHGADAASAYLGDDLTDEDAFRAIAPTGLGILVRSEWRATAAGAWLRPPQDVISFLDRWLAARAEPR